MYALASMLAPLGMFFVEKGDFKWIGWAVLAVLLVLLIMRRSARKRKDQAKG